MSYWPGQVQANGTVPVARWAAPWLLLGGEALEKGTPRRDAPAQHPLLRPGPRPGAGQSWSVPHGAATRAQARKQLQAGGRPAKGRWVLCQWLTYSPTLSKPLPAFSSAFPACELPAPWGKLFWSTAWRVCWSGNGENPHQAPRAGQCQVFPKEPRTQQAPRGAGAARRQQGHCEPRPVPAGELPAQAGDTRSLPWCLAGREVPACAPLALSHQQRAKSC